MDLQERDFYRHKLRRLAAAELDKRRKRLQRSKSYVPHPLLYVTTTRKKKKSIFWVYAAIITVSVIILVKLKHRFPEWRALFADTWAGSIVSQDTVHTDTDKDKPKWYTLD